MSRLGYNAVRAIFTGVHMSRIRPIPIGGSQRRTWFVLSALLLVLGGGVAAQTQPASRLVAQLSGSGVSAQRPTTDKEKLAYADDAVREMRDGMKELSGRIDEARRVKDISLLNKLNEAQASINALLKVTETAQILLQEAIAMNTPGTADHQIRKIMIAREKAAQILRDSRQFVGDEQDSSGSSDGEVQVLVDEPLSSGDAIGSEPEPVPIDSSYSVPVDVTTPEPSSP